ncbi:MAG: pyrroloquinoline quinone-dependent dehydrogenase [Vicinamibacterales bacterium]
MANRMLDRVTVTRVPTPRMAGAGVIVLLATALVAQSQPGRDWPVYGGDSGGSRYSPLRQINRSNVRRLQIAWQFDPSDGPASRLQAQPIIVDGILYAPTPGSSVLALDAKSGQLKWSWNSGVRTAVRGITYWTDGKEKRLLAAFGRYIYALDAGTGQPFSSFGRNGRIDLHHDLGRDPDLQTVGLTAPGIIYKDFYIVGGRTSEGLPASPGDIRGYDVRTGALRWSFHTIPHPGEYGYDTWPKDAWTYSGSANNWAGMAVDSRRGIVYVPTGSAAADFYGANRVGDNLFANSLLALNAETGERLWHFQAVKHDIWDRDFPSPPTLLTIRRDGKTVDAVAQTTKHGFVFLFDRVTGKPLFPIEYRRVPPSTVDGEVAADTQPFPLKPAPFARQLLTEDMLTRRTPAAHQWALAQFGAFRSGGQFVPLSVGKETVIFPGFDGGAEWGGAAVDPQSAVMYVNSNDIAWTSSLRPSTPASPSVLKYIFSGYRRWYDPDGYPAVAPPWGTLNAIDLNTGDYVWKAALGEYPELVAQGMRDTGTENYGGPIVTAGGLLFIGATNFDKKFRAFDKDSGKLLWETTMVNAGNSTPATYEVDGRQYVVIAAFGGYAGRRGGAAPAAAGAPPQSGRGRGAGPGVDVGAGGPSGGAFIAFALPQH